MAGGRKKRSRNGSSTRSVAVNNGPAKRLRSAKGRKTSSSRWLTRQLRDPYVAAARKQGFRSRAAFKLKELDDRYRFLKPGGQVVDLGAAPGGWSQVAAERVKATHPGGGRVLAVDCVAMDAVAGVNFIMLDFLSNEAPESIRTALGGLADVVLSDMAAPATGHAATDHLRIMTLLEAAITFAHDVLKPGGVFVGKVLRGGAEKDLLEALKRDFQKVRHVKPPASRKESAEIYLIATGFRAIARENADGTVTG